MKNIVLTGLLLTSFLVSMPLRADDNEVETDPDSRKLTQPGPADPMLFELPRVDNGVIEKKYPLIDLKVGGIENGKPIPEKFAYCAPDGNGQTKNAANISPAIHWLKAPVATRSFVLLVVDPDVPASFDDANKPGKELRAKSPRQDFYHWVLVDIPANSLGFFEGADSTGIVPGGKALGKKEFGTDGKNDFSNVFNAVYGGYDGPCPPWNDLRLHHYHFILYALDIPSLGLHNPISGALAKSAMQDHIIAKGEVVGTYSNNPRWLAQFKKEEENDRDMTPGDTFKP